MLKIIEFGLLGVSLAVVIGLIVSGARQHSDEPERHDSTLPDDQHKPL